LFTLKYSFLEALDASSVLLGSQQSDNFLLEGNNLFRFVIALFE
jgi:hypothetical protein